VLRTRFTELVGCEVPLQQAGMGTSDPALAAAVAGAGALGMVSGVLVPPDALAETLASMRPRAGGAVGVNFLVPFLDDPASVDAAAAGARVVEFFFGDPDAGLVARAHAGGALASWQVGSVAEAVAAADAGCDLVVVQGVEAGGHVRGRMGLLPLLAQALDSVSVPVLAAGGIGTPRAMAAALAAGADGVRVGTRFVAAHEAGFHPAYVEALIASDGEDTVLTDVFHVMWPGAPHRVLRASVDAAREFAGDVVGAIEVSGARLEVPRFGVPSPIRSATGEIAAMAHYAGQAVGAVRAAQPAAEIVHELVDGAERLLRRWRAA
jgi:NAD(P)H-dependent flavin oxidoreductase YrpB (nitropropane dioxygenase family)